MKTKLLLSLLLATALCFYGCEEKTEEEKIEEEIIEEPDTVTLTIVPTPSDANVTINGEERSSITAERGTEAVWEVSAEGYVTQDGTLTLDEDTDLPVTLEEEVDPWFSESGDGTKDDPYSVPQLREMTDDEITHFCYVKGIVAHNGGGTGTAEEGFEVSYHISEDGKYDGKFGDGNCMLVLAGTALGGEKFTTFMVPNLGDIVIVYGEFVRGDWWGLYNNMLYYWNGEFAENWDKK